MIGGFYSSSGGYPGSIKQYGQMLLGSLWEYGIIVLRKKRGLVLHEKDSVGVHISIANARELYAIPW